MARKLETTTKDFMANEFIDLVESVEEPKTFTIQDKDFSTKVIENNIERVEIKNNYHNNDYEISRTLEGDLNSDKNQSVSVSSKYEPVLFSETLLSMRNTGVLNAIQDDIDSVQINFNTGDIKMYFNQQNLRSNVLDIFPNSTNPFSLDNMRNSVFGFDDFGIDRTDFGDFQFVLNIQNSFDRKKAIGFFLGTYRLICSNGLVIPDFEIGHIKKRHFSNSKDTALNFIEEKIQDLPLLVKNMKDDTKNNFIESYQKKSDLMTRSKVKELSREFVSDLHKWRKDKESKKTFHKNMTIKKSVNSLHNTFTNMFKEESVTDNISNLFDISNIFSYFTSDVEQTRRFSRTTNILAKEVEHVMRKVIDRV